MQHIEKNRAIKLLDEKVSAFEQVLKKATYENRFDEEYRFTYSGTEALIKELFPSGDEVTAFRREVSTHGIIVLGGTEDPREELADYKKHIQRCVTQLKVYKERISNFWSDAQNEAERASSKVPFIAMSFDEADKDVNQYFKDILAALRVAYETGERYSKDSIPEKVRSRIFSSDCFICVLVKRDKEKLETGGYATPPWLIKELGIAQGAKKGVIALVEKDIKDIAGLDYEKEVIYFDRDDVKEMQKATVKFLEALKDHGII